MQLLQLKLLLKVYYSYRVFGTVSGLLFLCDIPSPAKIALVFALQGERLRHQESILRVLMTEVPEFRELILNEDPPEDDLQDLINEYEPARVRRPAMSERKRLFSRLSLREAYRANIIWHYFRGPILEWCASSSTLRQLKPGIAFKAMDQMVSCAARRDAFWATGSSIFEMIYRFYHSENFNVELFLRIGGLSPFFECCCEYIFLPPKC